MAVTAPWDLVTATTVPSTVEWWSLRAQPNYPVTMTNLIQIRNQNLVVNMQYGPPNVDSTGKVAWRDFVVEFSDPDLDEDNPVDMAYIAVVDLTLMNPLLALFSIGYSLDLENPTDVMHVQGNLQATRY